MEYEHTQHGPLFLRFLVIGLLAIAAIITALTGSAEGVVILGVVALVVGGALFVFNRLTVKVTDQQLIAHFGWGWPRKSLPWQEAKAVRRVRNRWWYGWGIRWFPGGTLWNVWGLDAVEFDLESGSALRIGTDEPDRLLAVATRHVRPG